MLDWFHGAVRRFMVWVIHSLGGITPDEVKLPETISLINSAIVDKSAIPKVTERYLAERIAVDMLSNRLCKIDREERTHVTRCTAKVTVVFPGEESQ